MHSLVFTLLAIAPTLFGMLAMLAGVLVGYAVSRRAERPVRASYGDAQVWADDLDVSLDGPRSRDVAPRRARRVGMRCYPMRPAGRVLRAGSRPHAGHAAALRAHTYVGCRGPPASLGGGLDPPPHRGEAQASTHTTYQSDEFRCRETPYIPKYTWPETRFLVRSHQGLPRRRNAVLRVETLQGPRFYSRFIRPRKKSTGDPLRGPHPLRGHRPEEHRRQGCTQNSPPAPGVRALAVEKRKPRVTGAPAIVNKRLERGAGRDCPTPTLAAPARPCQALLPWNAPSATARRTGWLSTGARAASATSS